jgi:UDP-N-acetyl-L-fucosamine synthase
MKSSTRRLRTPCQSRCDAVTLKVTTVLGTRPEIIRLSRVIALLDRSTDHQLVHTGQNYDYQLNEIFFEDLEVRRPDHFLGVDTRSLGTVLGETLMRIEEVLTANRPDAVLILGDTNSSIAGLMARRMRIPLYHMEAGNRCFDPNVPEEINRRIIDHLADFNLPYTEHARRHLLAEGLHPRRIHKSGSPMREVLEHYRLRIDASDVLDRLGVASGQYCLVSMHREENVDNPVHLDGLLTALVRLAHDRAVPVIVSTHPRTRDRLTRLNRSDIPGEIRFLEPLGFFDYNQLQLHAACTLSDSGTISEESAILGFPAVTIRNSMERPEALETGAIALTGLRPEVIVELVEHVERSWLAGLRPEVPDDYLIRNCSQRVVNLIVSTARVSGLWAGLAPVEQGLDSVRDLR